MSEAKQWPREIWLAELEDHHNGQGRVVLSEHATVPRYEGCPITDCDFHGYVDADILTSTEKYYAARIEALEAQVKALTRALHPEMAAALMEAGAHKCVLSSDEHMPGWVSGLSIDRIGEMECVAHLDHEDSQYGPRLWDYALSVLKAYATLAQIKGGE